MTEARTWCVPSSIFCAWVWAGKFHDPVRIAVTKIAEGVDHSQAEALINEVWTPLTEIWNGECMAVIPYQRHYNIEPYRFVTLQKWISEQIRYAK